jgi:2-amino-4-hydroxy-6-hydroxymethyldihydropteridine diphosphokinase
MPINRAVLLLGSNIQPESNLSSAIRLIKKECRILNQSSTWKTESFGSEGPDFLNTALQIETTISLKKLKTDLIRRIETELKRVRTINKNAPRTIDIDIIWFNDEIIDNSVFTKLFVALPVSELLPDTENENTHEKLPVIAEKLKSSAKAELFTGKLN